MLGHIGQVPGSIGADCRFKLAPQCVRIRPGWVLEIERPGLGVNEVVAGKRAGLSQRQGLGTVDDAKHLFGRTPLHHRSHVGMVLILCGDGQQASQHRGYARGQFGGLCFTAKARCQRTDLRAFADGLLAGRNHGDVSFVRFTSVIAEGDQAMLEQHDPLDAGIGLMHIRHGFGKIETGPYVRDDRDVIAEDPANPTLAVRLIGQREHGIGVGVIHAAVRQKCVHECLNRRRRRRRIEQVRANLIDHLRIVECIKAAQAAQIGKVEHRHILGLDGREVTTAALDVNGVYLVTEERPVLALQ